MYCSLLRTNLCHCFLPRRSALLRDLAVTVPSSASVSTGSHYEPIEFYGMRQNEVAPGIQKLTSEKSGDRRSVSPQDWLEVTAEHLSGASTESVWVFIAALICVTHDMYTCSSSTVWIIHAYIMIGSWILTRTVHTHTHPHTELLTCLCCWLVFCSSDCLIISCFVLISERERRVVEARLPRQGGYPNLRGPKNVS